MRQPYIIELQNIESESGVLNILEVNNQIQFDIKRIFILNDIFDNVQRGNHAHKETDQLLICLSGEIIVHTELPNGCTHSFKLTDSRNGLFIPAEAWHYMEYIKNSIQVVCASHVYDESDYLRTKEIYLNYYNEN